MVLSRTKLKSFLVFCGGWGCLLFLYAIFWWLLKKIVHSHQFTLLDLNCQQVKSIKTSCDFLFSNYWSQPFSWLLYIPPYVDVPVLRDQLKWIVEYCKFRKWVCVVVLPFSVIFTCIFTSPILSNLPVGQQSGVTRSMAQLAGSDYSEKWACCHCFAYILFWSRIGPLVVSKLFQRVNVKCFSEIQLREPFR